MTKPDPHIVNIAEELRAAGCQRIRVPREPADYGSAQAGLYLDRMQP